MHHSALVTSRQEPIPGQPLRPPAHRSFFRIPLPTGVDLHYVAAMPEPPITFGTDPIDEAILLIHGYSDSWRSFEEMLDLMPISGYDVPVFAPDLRGHGLSSSPASGPYTQAAFAADVAAFMDVLKIRQAVVVGHSMGGLIAHLFAVTYPEKVRALVLIATAASMAGHPVIAESKPAVDHFDDAPAPVDFVEDFQRSTFYEPAAPHVLYRYVSESLRLRGRVWKETLHGMEQEDHRNRLPTLVAPTLLLWGEQDAIFSRAHQEELMTLIPNATLVTYPGAGHALNVERAAEIVEAIRAS